jgi:7-carboxy-7-deazaguanine synthase
MDKNKEELLKSGEYLPIMEHFYTIQGEGANTGKPAYFIRVGGCDVGCHWCDVKESWNADLHPLIPISDLIPFLKDISSKDIVITGGEPSLYNLNPLCNLLKSQGFNTFIETSGAYELSGKWDWICLSPKKTSPPTESIYHFANELKVIIFNQDDFKWAEIHAEKCDKNCRLFLQPEWSKLNTIMPEVIEYVMKNPKWNISLQSHKFMHIP